MPSYTAEQERYLADYQADLDTALSGKDFKKAAEIIFTVHEEGYEHEARIMHGSMQRAYSALSDEDFIQGFQEEFDPRDDADRNYP